MDKIPFFLVFGAFVIEGMERFFEQRGARAGDGESKNPAVLAWMAGVAVMVAVSTAGAALAVAPGSVLQVALGLACLGTMALAFNTIAGGAQLYPNLPARIVNALSAKEGVLRRWVFPSAYVLAFVGLAWQAVLTFSGR